MRSTRAFLAAGVAALLSACSAPTPAVDIVAETAAVSKRSEEVAAAEAAKDKAKALTYWAPDAIVQPAGMPEIKGHEAIGNLYTFMFDSTGLKSFSGKSSGFTVSGSGDVAFETGVHRIVFGTPKGDLLDQGKYLAVWKKTNGTWFISALSFTSDTPAPVPIKP
jgi:ketosteroid isomerase-like protein